MKVKAIYQVGNTSFTVEAENCLSVERKAFDYKEKKKLKGQLKYINSIIK